MVKRLSLLKTMPLRLIWIVLLTQIKNILIVGDPDKLITVPAQNRSNLINNLSDAAVQRIRQKISEALLNQSSSNSNGIGDRSLLGSAPSPNAMNILSAEICAGEFSTGITCDAYSMCCQVACDTFAQDFNVTCNIAGSAAKLSCQCKDEESNDNGDNEHKKKSRKSKTTKQAVKAIDPDMADMDGQKATTIETTSSSQAATTVEPKMKPRGNSATKNKCGKSTVMVPHTDNEAIIGEDAVPHSWPWQVSLQYDSDHLCSGVLVDEKHVLTAAHCVEEDPHPEKYMAILGAHDLQEENKGQMFNVSQIDIDPGRNSYGYLYDTAVITLSTRVSFSNNISPVCLPGNGVSVGTRCVTTGWMTNEGQVDRQIKVNLDKLTQVWVPVIDHSECAGKDQFGDTIDESIICAGGHLKGNCKGDSGGPFVCPTTGGLWELQGIASFGGLGCALSNKTTAFSSITNSIAWIKKIVQT